MHTISKVTLLLSVLAVSACRPDLQPTAEPSTATAPPALVQPTSTGLPPVPSATSTLPPAPSVFEEDFQGSAPYWSFRQVDNGGAAAVSSIADGFLHFELSEPNQWLYAIYDGPVYSDVLVDALVATSAGEGGSTGVVCRYSPTEGWYEFDIYPDQTYVLLFGKWLAEGVARYTTLVQSTSEKIKTGENEIGLLCQGDILTPYVNSTQLARRQEKTFGLATGGIAVTASSFETAPLRISYDWVKVSEP